MAFEHSFVTDSGGMLAHQNLLKRLRDAMGGFGELGAVTTPGANKGQLLGLDALPRAKTETWTITCTTATPVAKFSVTGSVTGAMPEATVNVAYSAGIAFTIVPGSSAYVLGDTFSFAVTEGLGSSTDSVWEVLKYDTTEARHVLILKGEGLSKQDEIFIGLYTYQNVAADIYNLSVFAMTGYVPGNTLETQPAIKICSVPCHNYRADYWLSFNRQRICLAIKAGTPVYESLYLGKMLPYATPGQYPYPVVVGGMVAGGSSSIRYSEVNHSFPYKGNRTGLGLISNSGAWLQPHTYPWNNPKIAGAQQIRDTNESYAITPIVLSDTNGVYGELDGVYHVSGFNNVVENIIQTPEADYVVIQDVGRTGFNDYYALRMN